MQWIPPTRRLAVAAAAVAAVSVPSALLVPAAVASDGAGVPAQLREHNTDGWWYDAMKIASAQKTLDGSGVSVAVLDGAIDLSAPELKGADITLGQTCEGGRTRSVRVASEDPDAGAGVHGTQMAATIVGQGRGNGPGGAGILGVAPRARVLYYGLGDGGTGPIDGCDGADEGAVIRAAVKDGADIIMTATGATTPTTAAQEAITWAQTQGVVVVASAGDIRSSGGAYDFPAGYPGVVSVNAVDRNAKPWPRNPQPQTVGDLRPFPVISAPGVHTNSLMWFDGRFDSTGWSTGTSPATAIVAGALALVKQKYPDASGNQLIQTMIHNTGGEHDFVWSAKYGFGIVSVPKMLQQDPTGWPDENPLLKGPMPAIEDYPDSRYGQASAGESTTASAEPSPTGSASPAPATSSAADTTATQTRSSDGSGGGLPVWAWAIGAVAIVAGGAFGAVKALRRQAA